MIAMGLAVIALPNDDSEQADAPATTQPEPTCAEEHDLPDGVSCARVAKDYEFAVWLAAWEHGQYVAFLDGVWASYQASLVPTYPSSSGGAGWCNEAGIIDRESGGDPTVYNTQGSGASGLYQFMPGTWDGYGGYANAADAPPEVQREKFLEVWAGGAGSSHWSC